MPCPHCNFINRPAAKVCAQCGTPLPTTSAQAFGPILKNRYQLVSHLGKGGMGSVYLAEDITLFGHKWVVKEMLLPDDPADQPEAVKNFQMEAQLLEQLKDDRIPKIFEFFPQGNKYYIVMERVEGQDLEQRLRQHGTALGQGEVVEYARQILDVLEYLARQHPPVIHRDIKPANIIVDQNGKAFLVDFGIARAKPAQSGIAGRDTSLYGTKGYAPREQYAGETEPRSDIYALGATIHHLLTNRDPGDPQHRSFEPLTQLVPTIKPRFAQLVTQMLNDAVAARPTATEAKQQLKLIFPPAVSLNKTITPKSGKTFLLTNVESLILFGDQQWQDALGCFFDRDFEVWLSGLQQPELGAQAEQLRLRYNQQRNRGLELFLEACEKAGSPRPNRPRLVIQPPMLDLGELFEDTQRKVILRNDGGGYFFGTILTDADWLGLSFAEFEGNKEHHLEIKTDLSKLQPGQHHEKSIVVDSNDRRYELKILVTRVNADVYIQRGLANYRALQLSSAQRLAGARKNFAAARTCKPNETQASFTSAAIALILYEQGVWNEFFSWCEQRNLTLAQVTLIQAEFPVPKLATMCRKWGDELYRRARQNPTRQRFEEVIQWYMYARQLDKNPIADQVLARAYIDLAQFVCQTAAQAPFRDAVVDFEFAITQYRHAVQLDPTVASAQGLAKIYLAYALAADRASETVRAFELSETAHTLAPNDPAVNATYVKLGQYARREKQFKTWVGIGTAVAVGIGLLAFLLPILPFLKWQPIGTVAWISLSAIAITIAVVFTLFWQDRRWLLVLGKGRGDFVGGITISASLWILAALLIGFVCALFIARTTLNNPNLRMIAEFGWLLIFAVGILLFIVESRIQPSQTQVLEGGFVAGAVGVAFLLGIVLGYLFNGAQYGNALHRGIGFVFGLVLYAPWFIQGGVLVLCGGLLYWGFSKDTRLAIYILGGVIGLFLVIFLGIIPLFIALWERLFLPWSWGGAFLGAVSAIGTLLIIHNERLSANSANPIRWWWVGGLCGSLGIAGAFLLSAQVIGVLGLVLAIMFASVLIGVGGFVISYSSGPRLVPHNSRLLLTRSRLWGLAFLLGILVLVMGLEFTSTRVLEKVSLYEQGHALLASGDLKRARSVFQTLESLDPGFENVQALARNVNLKITKGIDPSAAPAGAIITYTIVIENAGGQDATDVSMTDVLPAGVTVLQESLPQNVTLRLEGGQPDVEWRGTIRANTTVTIPIQAKIDVIAAPLPATAPLIVNSVRVDDGAGGITTRQANVRVLPTYPPSQTPTSTNTPPATVTPTASRTPTRTPTLELSATPIRTPTLEQSTTPSPLPTPAVLTVASEVWANEQGKNGWWYEEGSSGDWANWQEMQWDPQLPNCPTGCWRSNAAPAYVRVDQLGGHPGLGRYVAKRWLSSIAGQVRVRVSAYLAEQGGNGVTLRIVKNGEVLKEKRLDGNQTRDRAVQIEFETPITIGGWIMCTIDSNGNTDNDYTFFDMAISKLP